MLKLKNEKKPKKVTPHYILEYNYMIGDADGDTIKKIKVSFDNPFIERHCTLLNSLRPTKGRWGISLDDSGIEDTYKEKQITKDDYHFLLMSMFDGYIEDGEVNPNITDEKQMKFLEEFHEGIESETEYSFLTFEGVDIYYVDENDKKHEVEIK